MFDTECTGDFVSHPPGSSLPLLSTSPAVTFRATHYRPVPGTKLYCLAQVWGRSPQSPGFGPELE